MVGAFEPLSRVRPEKLRVMLRLLEEFLSSFSCGQVRDVRARDLCDEIAQEIIQGRIHDGEATYSGIGFL
jgi:hypothetical protein